MEAKISILRENGFNSSMADRSQPPGVDREHSSDFNEQAALDAALNIPPPSYQQAVLHYSSTGITDSSHWARGHPRRDTLSPGDAGLSLGVGQPLPPSTGRMPINVRTRSPCRVLAGGSTRVQSSQFDRVPTVVHAGPSYYCQTLPNYQPCVDPNSPPPDYNSLFGRAKTTTRDGEGSPDIFLKCSKFACTGALGKALCTFTVVLLVAVLVFMIVIGSLYRFDCPAQDSLPLYLIVSGSVPLVWAVRCFSHQPCPCVDRQGEDERRRRARQRKFEGMAIVDAGIFCFIFAWFVIGSYWVYGMWNWSTDPTSSYYCHPMVYYLVFWSITTIYVIGGCVGGIVIIVVLGIYCCHFWTEYIKPSFCGSADSSRVTEL